ncbi:MAG TPA: prepilin-type N-terminal cleavage/methylation domain-containing protein [Nitrospira sp.]|nr:prepilin-type N-terminal cleavage/methylation domain-containing protein [Nitrospira sp.]
MLDTPGSLVLGRLKRLPSCSANAASPRAPEACRSAFCNPPPARQSRTADPDRQGLDHRGFTLIEVLIALAILAISLPVLLGLRNFDLDLAARARDITAATMLAQEKLLEAELSTEFPVGETAGDFRTMPPGTQSTLSTQNRAERFRWKRLITSTPLPNVREIKVQVIWPRGVTDEMVEVSTYVFSATSF